MGSATIALSSSAAAAMSAFARADAWKQTNKEDRREQRRCSAGGLGPTYVDDPHGRDDADEGDAHHEGDAQHQARLGEGVGRAQHTHAQRVVYQKGT